MHSLLEVASLAVKTRGARMERYIVRRLFVVGAELRHFKRLIVVRGDNFFALLDRFANRISRVIPHVGAHNHGPAAEIDGGDILGHPGEAGLVHDGRTIAHRNHTS